MVEQEYFTVNHALKVNIEKLDQDFSLPDDLQLEAEIPLPFRVANEFSKLDALNDLARQDLKNSEFKNVIQLLEAQNSKLNMLLNFMLTQQDDTESNYTTVVFGASQLVFQSSAEFAEHDKLRVKLFLEHPAAAIYLYGHVSECEQTDEQYLVTIKYDCLRDEDQDLLIKAALYHQQKLLRQRSLDRNK